MNELSSACDKLLQKHTEKYVFLWVSGHNNKSCNYKSPKLMTATVPVLNVHQTAFENIETFPFRFAKKNPHCWAPQASNEFPRLQLRNSPEEGKFVIFAKFNFLRRLRREARALKRLAFGSHFESFFRLLK